LNANTPLSLAAALLLATPFSQAAQKPAVKDRSDMSTTTAPHKKMATPHALHPGASAMLTVSPEAFMTACHADMDTARKGMAEFKTIDPKKADSLHALEVYDNANAALGNAQARASLTHEVHPDPAVREAAEKCEQELSSLATDFSLDKGIYNTLSGLNLAKDDAATKYWVSKDLRDFRLAGVDRDDATRAKVKQLRDDLTKLGQEFDKNIREDVRHALFTPAELDGLPEDFIKSHPVNADGKVSIATDNTDYVPVLTYAKSTKTREEMWRLYRLRAHPKNLDVLAQMLQKRYELANLLGYKDWADYVTQDKMIGSGKNAADFIEKITAAADARSKHDYEELLARGKKDDASLTEIKPWDSTFLSEAVKREQYQYDSQKMREYFPYPRVKQGVLDTTSKLFGIEYRPVKDAKVWHQDVDTYDVYEGKRLLGRIYLDMYPRDGKYKHYAQFTLMEGKEGVTLPEGVLVCNFPKPSADNPGLMDANEVRTFFHEFGHLLHHVLGGHTRWSSLAGVRTEWDFVEAPSQMLEEWMRDPAVLASFARHYQTNEPLPADLVKKMRRAEEFGKGLQVRQQMFYAATSLDFHNRDPKSFDSTELMSQLQNRYTPFHYVPGTYMHESFGHLNGYSAIYYTYMWSLVIAKDMFSEFKKHGIMDPHVAARYRRAVLQQGGSKPAATLVSDFLGRPYDFKAYEEWLNQQE
jgi:Zn-dependent oligopeptidase